MRRHSPACSISEEQVRFLGNGRLSVPNNELIEFAETLKGDTSQQTIKNILEFVSKFPHEELESTNNILFRIRFAKRSASEIFVTGVAYDCCEYATLFVTLCRVHKIPAKFVTGKRIGKSGTHRWPEVFHEGRWKAYDAVNGQEFDPATSTHGPYRRISESLDAGDSAVRSWMGWGLLELREKLSAILPHFKRSSSEPA